MTSIRFEALPSDIANAYRRGEPDSYGLRPERRISDGGGVPCRHCLRQVSAGDAYLIVAHRPFPALQPYAETGPIFLHAEACERHMPSDALPPVLHDSPDFIVRGYGFDDRIVYGTGAVVPIEQITERASALFGSAEVAYLHVRSARNNCYQCRIDRS